VDSTSDSESINNLRSPDSSESTKDSSLSFPRSHNRKSRASSIASNCSSENDIKPPEQHNDSQFTSPTFVDHLKSLENKPIDQQADMNGQGLILFQQLQQSKDMPMDLRGRKEEDSPKSTMSNTGKLGQPMGSNGAAAAYMSDPAAIYHALKVNPYYGKQNKLSTHVK